jgi:hypothetical protein
VYDIVKYACCFTASVTCSISGGSCDLVYDDWNEKFKKIKKKTSVGQIGVTGQTTDCIYNP